MMSKETQLKTFKLYVGWYDWLQGLTFSQAGKIFAGLFEYKATGKIPDFITEEGGETESMFTIFVNHLKTMELEEKNVKE